METYTTGKEGGDSMEPEKNRSELSDRKKQILKAIVEMHIRQGEPIGSKYLMDHYNMALSSATIRNEMAELEDMGYLEQPHTSAGRVPSKRGYRFYVDALMNRYHMTEAEIRELNRLLKMKLDEMDKILDSAGRLMSLFTNYTSVTVRPKQREVTIQRFDVIQMDPFHFILVMTVHLSCIRTKNIRVAFPVTGEVLQRLVKVLNEQMAGRTMEDVTLPVMMKMESDMEDYAMLITPIVKSIYEVIRELNGGDIKFEGVNKLLQYPEYADVGRIREFFELLEKKETLLDVVADAGDDKVNIYIGGESPVDAMDNATLIFKKLTGGGKVLGAIGVIGPYRMDYARVVAMVDTLAGNLSKLLEKSVEDNLLEP